jgi:hypothetical protein
VQEGEENGKYAGSFLLLGTFQYIAMDAKAAPCWLETATDTRMSKKSINRVPTQFFLEYGLYALTSILPVIPF